MPPERAQRHAIEKAMERVPGFFVSLKTGQRLRGMSGYYDIPLTKLVTLMIEAALDGKIFVPETKVDRVELKEISATERAQDRLKKMAIERARLRGEIVGAGDGSKLPFGLNDPRLQEGAGGGHGDDGPTAVPRGPSVPGDRRGRS